MSRDVRSDFEQAVIFVLTEGRVPGRSSALGVTTWAAFEAIAREHPEAAAVLINDAYYSFQIEESHDDVVHHVPGLDP